MVQDSSEGDAECTLDIEVMTSKLFYILIPFLKTTLLVLCMNPIDVDFEFDESVWVEVKLKGEDKLLLGCIYRSPNSTENNNSKDREGLKKMCELKHSHLLICGDFNIPEINWITQTANTSTAKIMPHINYWKASETATSLNT